MEILFGLKIVLLMHKKWSRKTRWALRSVIPSLKYSYLSENTQKKKKDKSCHKHFDSCCFFVLLFFLFRFVFFFFLVLVFFVLFLFCFLFFWCDPEFWDRNGYCK